MKKFILILCMAIAAIACTNEVKQQPNEQNGFTIFAEIEPSLNSRVNFDNYNLKMYWDFGYELFLFNINDYQDTVRLMAVKIDNGRATFVSNKLIPVGSYVAVSYGYSDFYLSDDLLYVSCQRMVEQAGKSSNHIGDGCVMAGTKIIKIEEGTKSAECQLRHELTLLECEVKLAKAQEGVEIHEITLKQNDNKNILAQA